MAGDKALPLLVACLILTALLLPMAGAAEYNGDPHSNWSLKKTKQRFEVIDVDHSSHQHTLQPKRIMLTEDELEIQSRKLQQRSSRIDVNDYLDPSHNSRTESP